MTIADRSRVDLREVLRTTCAASPVEAIDVMADGLATLTGATYVQFLITNVTHRAVVRFAGSDANAARVQQENGDVPVVPLRGTVYDQVLRRQKIVRIDEGGGERILVPVTETGDALGVIDLHLPREADALVFADIAAVAEALARIVIASRRHSDLMDWAQDTAPFSLAAEIQRRLLPGSYTCETDRFTVAGWLEPANAVGGDTFDYSLNRDTLHLSVTDAVGNDVNAALLASVLLGSLRNSRRRGADLAEPGPHRQRRARGALPRRPVRHRAAGAGGPAHRLDDRRQRRPSAALPGPRRAGQRDRPAPSTCPSACTRAASSRCGGCSSNPATGSSWSPTACWNATPKTSTCPRMLSREARTHPRELVYELAETVLHATGGELEDDATVLCLDWRGGPGDADRPDREE